MIVKNETTRPLRVPLGEGKVLHLAPRASGNISARAAARPSVQRLVERGELSMVSEADTPEEGPGADVRAAGTQPARIQRKGLK